MPSRHCTHEDQQWEHHAACLGVDPELFYPGKEDPADLAAARAVCAECPVAADCLEYAILNGEKYGIWGGKSEKERRAIRRERRLAGQPNALCAICGDPFVSTNNNARYCGDACARIAKTQSNARTSLERRTA